MLLETFYQKIDEELLEIIAKYPNEEKLHNKQLNQNKGYALLIWFIDFYAQKDIYKMYITDGKDDHSCDIIFSNKNVQEEEIFYVVQSKWVLNYNTEVSKQEFGYALSDFANVLNGKLLKRKNEHFNKKYELLINHLEKNGKVKFIFFTLAQFNAEIEGVTDTFNKNYAPNISLEVIDIQRIRKDYIEFKFKEVKTNNPLEYQYDPEDSKIEIDIERFNKRDFLEFKGRAEAYIFILRPKIIYELFRKYRFSLFFKNVRNPIHRSNYNEKIVETLLKKPNAFWYFNNGITAITKIIPEVGVHAKKIKLEGLQIINGAQTVYSIYQAYQHATRLQRAAMDSDARLTFRLIRSSDEEFNMQITRYTNSQNPMEDRDFRANDSIQQRLQNESFMTNFWYEKRRDEFRLTKEQQLKLNINVIQNTDYVKSYLAFQLQNPMVALLKQDLFFVSHREHKDGLYETIFNTETHFNDLFAATIVHKFVNYIVNSSRNEHHSTITYLQLFDLTVLALSKILLQKYFEMTKLNNSGKSFKVNLHLMTIVFKEKITEQQEVFKVIKYTAQVLMERLQGSEVEEVVDKLTKWALNPSFYEVLKDSIEQETLDIAKIQAIDLSKIDNWSKILVSFEGA